MVDQIPLAETETQKLVWVDKHTQYPADSILNDAMRGAFTTIARVALPLMDVPHTYLSDLLYDAQNAAQMDLGTSAFLLVRATGTSWCVFDSPLVTDELFLRTVGVKAILRVRRTGFTDYHVNIHRTL